MKLLIKLRIERIIHAIVISIKLTRNMLVLNGEASRESRIYLDHWSLKLIFPIIIVCHRALIGVVDVGDVEVSHSYFMDISRRVEVSEIRVEVSALGDVVAQRTPYGINASERCAGFRH